MSIASTTPTTTSDVDVSGFEQMLEDRSIPCEMKIFHRGDDPAIYTIYWKPICPCPNTENACQRCLDLALESEPPIVRCGICGAITFSGPLRRLIARVEPIK